MRDVTMVASARVRAAATLCLATLPLLPGVAQPTVGKSPPFQSARPLLAPQTRHSLPLIRLVFSLDSKLRATAGLDGKVKLWSLESGQLLRTVWGQRDTRPSAAFETNGSQVRAHFQGDTVLRVDAATRETADAVPILVERDTTEPLAPYPGGQGGLDRLEGCPTSWVGGNLTCLVMFSRIDLSGSGFALYGNKTLSVNGPQHWYRKEPGKFSFVDDQWGTVHFYRMRG